LAVSSESEPADSVTRRLLPRSAPADWRRACPAQSAKAPSRQLLRAGRGRLVLVGDLAAVKPVLQHQIERAAGEAFAAGKSTASSLPALARNTQPPELGFEQRHRAKLGIAPEDGSDRRRLGFVDDQSAVLDVISARHIA